MAAPAGITPRITHRGVKTSTRLSLYRWCIEPLFAQPFDGRRLHTRDERRSDLSCGLSPLAALTRHKRLAA